MRRRLSVLAVLLACTGDITEPHLFAAQVAPHFAPSDTVEIIGAGDIAGCGPKNRDYATARIVQSYPDAMVFTLGDNAYPNGTPSDWALCYDPTWGIFKDRTYPTLGNHDCNWPDKQTSVCQPYYDYWLGVGVDSGRIGKRGKGYYAHDHGAWRLYFLNSERNLSEQSTWLRNDLTANPRQCRAALFHKPLFTSGAVGPRNDMRPFWQVLHEFTAEFIANGHQHQNEVFAAQDPAGALDPAGIVELVAGKGGATSTLFVDPTADHSEWRDTTVAVLHVLLRPGSYRWRYLDTLNTVLREGEGLCNGTPDSTPPDTTPTEPSDSTPGDTTVVTPSEITLTVTGELRSDGRVYNKLRWSGASGDTVEPWRDGSQVTTTENDGIWTNSILYRGAVTYVYRICQTGGAVCSNDAAVSYP